MTKDSSNRKGAKLEQFVCYCPPADIQKLDRLAKRLGFPTRAELMRFVVKDFISRNNGKAEPVEIESAAAS